MEEFNLNSFIFFMSLNCVCVQHVHTDFLGKLFLSSSRNVTLDNHMNKPMCVCWPSFSDHLCPTEIEIIQGHPVGFCA